MSNSNDRNPGRRDVMRLAASGAAALAGAAGIALPSRPVKAAGVTLPAFVPFKGPVPDLPGDSSGVPNGYTSFPKQLVKSVRSPPSRGGEVNALVQTVTQAPTAMDQNPAWQEINKQIGATMKLNISPQADYPAKFATVMAGGDLPDLVFIPPRTGGYYPPLAPQFLQLGAADLTPYLSGDAAREFPNLANISTRSWSSSVFAGTIRGVPISRATMGGVLYIRQDFVDKYGVTPPKSADDFKRFCKELTRPQDGVWALGNDPLGFNYRFFNQCFGGPNNWRLGSDGKLVKDIETEECKAAVSYIRELWNMGVWHPDMLPSQEAADTGVLAGKFAMRRAAWSNYVNLWNRANGSGSGAKIRTVPLWNHDGGKPIHHFDPGNFGFTAVKKGSPERVKELLRVLDFLTAPVGSEEHVLLNYGVKGVDFDYDAGGNPVLTQKGRADMSVPFYYIGVTPYTMLNPADPEFVKVAHADARALIPFGVSDPTIPVFSNTDAAKGGILLNGIYDRVIAIVTGRKPFSDYDQMVADWRSGGGNQIRDEYEKALAG